MQILPLLFLNIMLREKDNYLNDTSLLKESGQFTGKHLKKRYI